MLLYHVGLEVAEAVGHDLPDGGAAFGQPAGVVVGLEIAHHRRAGFAASHELGERLLQKRRLAGAGARHHVHHEHAGPHEPLPHLTGKFVVLLQDLRADLEDPGLDHAGGLRAGERASDHPTLRRINHCRFVGQLNRFEVELPACPDVAA